MNAPDWLRLFPEADYRLSMGLRPGNAGRFWSDWDSEGRLAAERSRWLAESAADYQGCLPEAGDAVREARSWMAGHSQAPEPDWVLLSPDLHEEPRVIAGEVVFPSSWALADKLGQPMSSVHAPVPCLQTQMGAGIRTFLAKIEPDSAWERENWGLAADDELNHHPKRSLPRLGRHSQPKTTWIRLEHQFLTRLPKSGSLLFGIRVTCHRLDLVTQVPEVRARIQRALSTLPEPLARYKGLHDCRHLLA